MPNESGGGDDAGLNIGSPKSNKPKFSKRDKIAAAAATVAIAGGGAVAYLAPGGWHGRATIDTGTEITANLFVVESSSSAGTTTCVRSATKKNYTDALAANAVCKNGATSMSWDIACRAASTGDDIGVMPGVYGPAGGYWLGGFQAQGNDATPYDCSKGGLDYNPNWREQGLADQTSRLVNWVNFKPAVDCSGAPNISMANVGRAQFAGANWHIIIGSRPGATTTPGGECFDFNHTVYIHDRNTSENFSNVRPSNVIFRGRSPSQRMQMYGMELRGPKNVLFENIDYGPNIICASATGPVSPAYFACNPSGPYFEAPFASLGINDTGCTPFTAASLCAGTNSGGTAGNKGGDEFAEPYIHGGTCCGHYENIRLQTFQLHDGQVRGTGAEVHPGCFMWDGNSGGGNHPSHNIVMDGVSCERQVIGVQSMDSGSTIQNSYFSCPVVDSNLTTPQGRWDVCASGQPNVRVFCRADQTDPDCVISNMLWRYNVFMYSDGGLQFTTPSTCPCPPGQFGTYSNVRAVGNIFIGSALQGCTITGITCANNSIFSTTATGAANTTTLSCDPTIDSDQDTSDDLWRNTTQLNPRLNGSACGIPNLDPSVLGADYQLGFDIDGDVRNLSSTTPGVDTSSVSAPITANVFVVASGGNPNCIRSATRITYSAAVALGSSPGVICGSGFRTGADGSNTPQSNACWAATAGDFVAVKNGTYSASANNNGALFDSNHDCSDGVGQDYNPNWQEQGLADPTANLANWVTYIPADEPQVINWTVRRAYFFRGNYHARFLGIDWRLAIFTNYGGEDVNQQAQNLIFDGDSQADPIQVHGIQIIGSKNIMFRHVNYGPSTQCGQYNSAFVTDFWECDPNGQWWEAMYANDGPAVAGCTPTATNLCGGFWSMNCNVSCTDNGWVEAFIHDGGMPYRNVRFEDMVNHDQNADVIGSGVHPGCLMTWDDNNSGGFSHNLVLDHYRCERATGATVQISESGITIQNSVFGCQVSTQGEDSNRWDQCINGGAVGGGSCKDGTTADGDPVGACTQTNVLWRYNVFIGGSRANGQTPVSLNDNVSPGGTYGGHANVRFVGNIMYGSPVCGKAGVTFDSNVIVDGTSCGTNVQSISGTDPLIDTAGATPGNLYLPDVGGPTVSSAFNVHTDGSPAITPINPTALNTACGCTDYTLGWDGDREARSSTSTKPGADG